MDADLVREGEKLRLEVERHDGMYFVISPDDIGMIVGGETLPLALSRVPIALKALLDYRALPKKDDDNG